MKKLASSLIAVVLVVQSHIALAQSEPVATLDVSIGGGVSTNPYLYSDAETAGSVTLSVSPSIIYEDEVGETRLGGNLRVSQYTNRYGSDVAARLEASTRRMLDELTSVNFSSSIQTARSAIQDGLIFDNSALPDSGPLLPPEIPIIDTTIAGTRARVTNVSTSIGISRALDELSSANASISLGATYIGGDFGFDYRNASAQLGYERKLSERTSVTLGSQFGVVDYLGRRTGDSFIVSPRIGVRQQLSDQLSVVADAGISYVDTDIGGGFHDKSVSFAGSVGVCNRGSNQNICLAASRSAQPTALGGVSTVTTVSLSYDTQISATDRIALSGRYGRTNQDGRGLPLSRVTDLVGVLATYTRELSDRVALTVTPSYSKIYDDLQKRDANFALMIGLTVNFGKQR